MSEKSTGVYVVRIESKEKHPNADALELIKIGGWTVVSKLGQYNVGDFAVYVPPESIVNTERPEFSFLNRGRKEELIKVKKIRGIYSQGLLIDKPAIECNEETNLSDYFGIRHYQPTDEDLITDVHEVKQPVSVSKYDIDSIRKYRFVFKDGEPVICTEKIHGFSLRFIYKDGTLYGGSRNRWIAYNDVSDVWRCFKSQGTAIEDFCKAFPNHILYGEGYGNNPGFSYGLNKGERGFMAFDIMKPDGTFINIETARSILAGYNIQQVPSWGVEPFDFEKFAERIEKPSPFFPSNICMEGMVIKPVQERYEHNGRACFKLVSNIYLEKT